MAARYSARVWFALVTIYVVWGSTFIALAIAVRDLPPFMSMALRHLVAGAALLVWALPRGDREGDRIGGPTIVAGFIFGGALFVLGHGSLAWAQQTVPGRRGRPARREHPDLDGPARPRLLREAAAVVGVRRLRARLRRARVPHRPVRSRLGRPRRRARDRLRSARLVGGLALLARRPAAEAAARLGGPRRHLRRHPAHDRLDRRRRARRRDLDLGRAPGGLLPGRRREPDRLHGVRLAPARGADLARRHLRVHEPDRRSHPRLGAPRRGDHRADGRRRRGDRRLGRAHPPRERRGPRARPGPPPPRRPRSGAACPNPAASPRPARTHDRWIG